MENLCPKCKGFLAMTYKDGKQVKKCLSDNCDYYEEVQSK